MAPGRVRIAVLGARRDCCPALQRPRSTCGPLYVAEAKYRAGLQSMMGHRRRKAKAQWFWYRDVQDIVTYVSTEAPARLEPRVWQPMDRPAILDLLKGVLWVPGRVDHAPIEEWDESRSSEDNQDGEDGQAKMAMMATTMDLSMWTDYRTLRLSRPLAIFGDEAKRNFGVDVKSGYIPREHRNTLEALMEEVLSPRSAKRSES